MRKIIYNKLIFKFKNVFINPCPSAIILRFSVKSSPSYFVIFKYLPKILNICIFLSMFFEQEYAYFIIRNASLIKK